MQRSGVRPSVCLSRHHTHRDSPGTACDAARVHFGWTVRKTDIVVDAFNRWLGQNNFDK